jgi:hypothetical protein
MIWPLHLPCSVRRQSHLDSLPQSRDVTILHWGPHDSPSCMYSMRVQRRDLIWIAALSRTWSHLNRCSRAHDVVSSEPLPLSMKLWPPLSGETTHTFHPSERSVHVCLLDVL